MTKRIVDILAGNVFISVDHAGVLVSRYENGNAGTLQAVPAKNAQELQDDALLAVENQGGNAITQGHFDCPLHIAVKGSWRG